jgi:hypothetical protein
VTESMSTTGRTASPRSWLTVPDLAEMFDVKVTKVHQLIRERALLAVRRDGVLRIPSEFVANDIVRKHLPGVLTVLLDAGYNDEEAMRWLYTEDPTLPGTPVDGLAGPLATEVKRRAQALGY